ncbi:MAG: methionyl-tRNA formyltransferase [bacterium]
MKIVFFATPDFAVPILDKLLKSNHQIAAVVTNTDKEQGRGKKIVFSPIKEYAVKNNIPILQPEKFKDPVFINQLTEINADLFIVVAFKILPKEVFLLPKFGSFNLHGSILPKYRGAAPIQWSLINGDTETGLTTFFLKETVDTGNVILQERTEIKPEDNFGSLHDRLSLLGADLVLRTVELIEAGNVKTYEQDNSITSPAPKITKDICRIDWNKPAKFIHNLIRGLSPSLGAFFERENKIYKVFKSALCEDTNLSPNEVFTTKKEIFIGCKNSTLQILEIQLEGKKKMTAEEFLRGNKI